MTTFIDLRATATGGIPVARPEDIKVLLYPPNSQAAGDPNAQPLQGSLADLHRAIDGKDVLLVAHGFNWGMAFGLQRLAAWDPRLQLPGTAAMVGILWPGDSSWAHGLDYPVKDNTAYTCGRLLAQYVNQNFANIASLSLASHSLGARVVLEALSHLDSSLLPVRQLILMAGAIDDDCLTGEYSSASGNVSRISVLRSMQDEVLEFLFPLGNPIAGIFDHTHPYFRGALGRSGPKAPRANLAASPAMPPPWKFGHSSYVTSTWPPPPDQSVNFAVNGIFPTAQTPVPSQAVNWQQAWMGAYVSSRLRS